MTSALPPLSRRALLGLGAGAGAAALLAACGGDSPAPGPASAGSGAATGEPVTVRTCVYAKNHASAALYWQQFAPKNWTIEVTPVTGAAQIQDALESGQLDFGLLGAYTTVIASSQGKLTSKIVGMIARQGIGLIGRQGKVATVADLRGKRVAVPPPGAQVLILTELLSKAGLTLGKDVTAVPLGYADHPAALERGDVDAYIGTEPLCTQSVVSGTGVRLPEVKNTPLGDFNTANWASGKILEERPDVVRTVVGLQKQAAEFLTPGGVNDRTRWKELLVAQFGYTDQVYEAVLGDVGAVWKFDRTREDQVKGAATLLLANGLITEEPDYESLFARQYWDV
jgi:ABC-type nitrate/sulfonate/bicarbonate transport system substrate-binding protein